MNKVADRDTRMDGVPSKLTGNSVRFLTFNVNGVRTMFHYQPFSQMHESLSNAFNYLQADVVTLQELKIDRNSVGKWGRADGFYSFVTIPVNKRGYSGVGCYIRIPDKDDPKYQVLQVVKAEEGITGFLPVKNGKSTTRYRDDPYEGIGGYESLGFDVDKEDEALHLDSQGRCILVELVNNVVIISTYCPANSTGTDEGNIFRMKFLKVLFRRITNLYKMGKEVVLMGDLNICRDMLDHAEYLETNAIHVNESMDGRAVEASHPQLARDFILQPGALQRRLLNQMLADSTIPELAKDGILLDTTRLIQTRERLKLYTVWSTLKNCRPVNYGSRVDFVLVTLNLRDNVVAADIMPNILGSDHCPVFADITLESLANTTNSLPQTRIPKFEARYKYNLQNHNVLDMFGARSASPRPSSSIQERKIIKVAPSKKVKSVDSFFKATTRISNSEVKNHVLECPEPKCYPEPLHAKVDKRKIASKVSSMFGTIPLCNHGEEATLRTSKTPANPGKKFWTCKRPKGESNNTECSCNFFQWA